MTARKSSAANAKKKRARNAGRSVGKRKASAAKKRSATGKSVGKSSNKKASPKAAGKRSSAQRAQSAKGVHTEKREKRAKRAKPSTTQRRVFFFGARRVDGHAEMRELLGGKGANLAEMTSLGIPVPPGFTISTEVCGEFNARGRRLPVEHGLRLTFNSNAATI